MKIRERIAAPVVVSAVILLAVVAAGMLVLSACSSATSTSASVSSSPGGKVSLTRDSSLTSTVRQTYRNSTYGFSIAWLGDAEIVQNEAVSGSCPGGIERVYELHLRQKAEGTDAVDCIVMVGKVPAWLAGTRREQRAALLADRARLRTLMKQYDGKALSAHDTMQLDVNTADMVTVGAMAGFGQLDLDAESYQQWFVDLTIAGDLLYLVEQRVGNMEPGTAAEQFSTELMQSFMVDSEAY